MTTGDYHEGMKSIGVKQLKARLSDAPPAAAPLHLPKFYRDSFVWPRCPAADPEYACSEMSLRGAVIEQQAHVTHQLGSIERVGHDEKQIDVLRLRLTRHERSEDQESRQVASRLSDAIDAFEAQDQGPSASRSRRRNVRVPRSDVPDAHQPGARLPQSAAVAPRSVASHRRLHPWPDAGKRGPRPAAGAVPDHFLRSGTTLGAGLSEPRGSSARPRSLGETFQRWPSSVMTVTVFRL